MKIKYYEDYKGKDMTIGGKKEKKVVYPAWINHTN